MSKPYEIRYLSIAEQDIAEIFEYIKKDNPTAAGSQLKNFDECISSLAYSPRMGVIPNDSRLQKLGYRILIIDRYLVFYIIKNKTVQIHRIIHGARRYGFLF